MHDIAIREEDAPRIGVAFPRVGKDAFGMFHALKMIGDSFVHSAKGASVPGAAVRDAEDQAIGFPRGSK